MITPSTLANTRDKRAKDICILSRLLSIDLTYISILDLFVHFSFIQNLGDVTERMYNLFIRKFKLVLNSLRMYPRMCIHMYKHSQISRNENLIKTKTFFLTRDASISFDIT